MLRNIPLMLDITREVVKAVNVPVTVKTRLGWDCENLIITDLAEQLQDCGIQALTIHGRTRSQMYTGEADWSLIGEVKNNPRIHIPIIGNGDITTPEEAKLAFERYGVDAVMIGRATFGRPWIFKEIRDYLDNTGATPLTVDEKIDLLEEQLRINVERIDEYRGILHTRRHLAASFHSGLIRSMVPISKRGFPKNFSTNCTRMSLQAIFPLKIAWSFFSANESLSFTKMKWRTLSILSNTEFWFSP